MELSIFFTAKIQTNTGECIFFNLWKGEDGCHREAPVFALQQFYYACLLKFSTKSYSMPKMLNKIDYQIYNEKYMNSNIYISYK